MERKTDTVECCSDIYRPNACAICSSEGSERQLQTKRLYNLRITTYFATTAYAGKTRFSLHLTIESETEHDGDFDNDDDDDDNLYGVDTLDE